MATLSKRITCELSAVQIIVFSLGIVSLLLTGKAFSIEPIYDKQKVSVAILEKARNVVKMASDDFIVRAVELQNAEKLTLEVIKQRDEAWIKNTELSLREALTQSDIGAYLKSAVERNRAIYSEIFLTDNQGANIAAYPPTSDYWQGDEEKFIVAFNDGKGQLLITPIEFDKSANTYASQIAVPVYNLDNVAIGVLFVGIKLSYAKTR